MEKLTDPRKTKVYEVTDATTRSGKNLKRLVLQQEGSQYPDKNVTMWEDHPLFNSIAPGQEHVLSIKVEDSTTPNPHGGFYKNKTVLKTGEKSSAEVAQMRVNTNQMQVLQAINRKLDLIMDKLEVTDNRQEIEDIRNEEVPPSPFDDEPF